MALSCFPHYRYDKYTKTFFKYANNIFSIFEIIKLIVMKIKLLKDHLDHTAGETIEVTEKRGGYLVRTKVGTEETGYKEPKGKKLKKPRKDGVTTVFTPEEHDKHIKHLNKDL